MIQVRVSPTTLEVSGHSAEGDDLPLDASRACAAVSILCYSVSQGPWWSALSDVIGSGKFLWHTQAPRTSWLMQGEYSLLIRSLRLLSENYPEYVAFVETE